MKSAYAQIRGDGQIEYPGENTLASIATTPVTGLCLKPNNYWDLQSSSRNKWLKAVKIIVNSIRSIPTWKESAMQLISKIPVGARTQAQAAVQKVVLQAPPQLKNMNTSFMKDLTKLVTVIVLIIEHLTSLSITSLHKSLGIS